ncbi:MAG: Gfo/Idh/MocA family protein [Anaerolineae bacterium]
MANVKKLRWGLLSTARINRALIEPIRQAERSELVAVASRSQERAKTYAATWHIPTAYGTYEALIAAPDIDAVYISLPNTLHSKWTLAAAEAGKHVLCEKPLVQTLAELDVIEETAARRGVTVFEAFMYLHHPQALRTRRMIEQGRLGRVQLLQSWFSFYLPPEQSNNIRLRPELGGGSFWDVGVYPNSMAITMMDGPPKEVWAQQIVGETGVDVSLIGQMRFGDGASAQIASSFRMPFRAGTVIVGDEGTVKLDQPWKPGMESQPSLIQFVPRDGNPQNITIEGIDPYLCEVQAMEACVLDGADPVVPLSRSRDFLRSALALLESARIGAPVAL